MFWTLALAHVLADYPLQTDALVRAKRNWLGVAAHVTIHLATMILLSGRDSLFVWPALIVLALAHFFIDILKSTVSVRWPKLVVGPYLLDQLFHFTSIFLVALWIERKWAIERDQLWMIYATAYLGATHVWFITERVVAHGDPRYLETTQAYQWSRLVIRGLALTIYLLVGGLLLPGEASAAPLAFLAMRLPPYGRSIYGRGMLLQDLIGPLLVAVLVLLLVR
jgi:hypothetical protein